MKNQKGFVLVMNLLLGTLLIGLLSMSAGIYICIQQQEKNQFLCQKRLLETQIILSHGLKKLMQLNPKASSLLIQEAKTIQELQMATLSQNPVLIAALTLRLEKIKSKEKVLQEQQNLIIAESKNMADLRLLKLKSDFNNLNSHLHIKNIKIPKATLAIESLPKWAIAPIYTESKPFTEKQTLEAVWQGSYLDLLPLFIKKYFINDHLFFSVCRTSMEGGEKLWQPHLTKGKS